MPSLEPSDASIPHRKVSKAAAWSLVFGLLSFCLSIFASLPAVILGIVGIVKVKNSNGILGGTGLAIAGITLGIVGFFASAIGAAVVIPAYVGVQDRAVQTKHISELRRIGLACRMFAMDHEDQFPATLEELVPDYLEDDDALRTNPPEGDGVMYLYRPGLTLSSHLDEAVAMEPTALRGRYAVLYADGHVERITVTEAENLHTLFELGATPE